MKNQLYIVLILLCFACKTDDPQRQLLVGRWQQTDSRKATDQTWTPADPTYVETLVFNRNGGVSGNDTKLSGGWCNYAKNYVFAAGKLSFEYTEPGCIPFVPPAAANYSVTELTAETLVIYAEFYGVTGKKDFIGAVVYRYKRTK